MKHVLRLEFEAFTNMENLIEQHCNNKDYNCVFFQRGFIDSMNKIFKVVWSKTKECYVVVSEVAKNNSGKKKVLASVLAALAVVGAGAGASVQAADMNTDTSANTAKQINIWANTLTKGNPANGGSSAPGSGVANANDVRPSQYGDEISIAIGGQNSINSTDNTSPGSGGSGYAIGNKNKIKGNRNVALGTSNKTYGDDSIAIGNQTVSGTGHGIAIGSVNNSGRQTVAYGSQNPSETGQSAFGFALAIGVGAQADGRANSTAGGIAIGQEVSATNTNSIVIGQSSEASGSHAITIGRGSSATNTGAMAFGYATNATGPASLAIGRQTNAKAYKSVAIGPDSIVNAQKTSSSYEFSGSNGTPSPAGYDTETITVNSGSAPASGAVAGNYYNAGSAVAIGDSASVSDESSGAVVVGPNAKTNGNAHYSVVLGSGSHADASDGFVGGHGSYVESRESIAMGSGANVRGNENIRSQAIGYGATVSGTGAYDATAIGATAQVSGVQGGVALGSGSLLSRTINSNENAGWNSKRLNGTVIRNRAYEATVNTLGDKWDAGAQIGAVSVGNEDQKRQIINVAAGSQDTDAVNVAQLKNVGVRVGADTNTATIGTNKVAADFLAYNGQLNIKGDNNRVTTVSENDANGKDANVNVKFDYDGLVKAKTGSAVTVDQKTDGNGKTYFEIDAAAASKTVLADGKNTTVTGAGTTASPYKVNVEGALTGISSITNNGGGKIEFATGGTTISGGPVNVSNNKITGVADGDVSSTSKDAVNGSQLHAVKTAERHIAPTTAGHEYTVDSNGDVTMTYLDGNNNAVANEKAVIKGIAKQDLTNINDAGKKVITGLGTIVKAGDNVNVSESSDATTGQKTYTVNAVTPAVYTKADGTKVYKRPDGTFTTNSNLAAGNNVDKRDVITSFMDGNGNTTGGNMVINNVGSAIDKTGTSTGSTFLTKLDTAATNTPNAAVNVKDLKTTSDALIDKGLNFTGNNEATVNKHKLGSLVKVQGEGVTAAAVPSFASAAGNIAVVANGTDTLELKLNKNLKGINSVSNGSSSITLNSNPGGTNNTPAVQITGGNLSMGNGTTNNKIVNLAPGTNDTDAVNYSQIKGLRTEVKQGANVTVSKTQGTDGHDIYTISAAATGGTASSWNIKSSADTANGGATATGHNANAVNISDQKTVEMVAGKNLTVKQDTTTDGAKVEFALSDNIVAGKDGANGKDGSVGATGKDGSSVVINGADGSIGMTGPKGQDGKDGINGRDGANISMTSAKGEQVLVNRDPAHSADTDKAERIVYVPKDASGNPIQDANGKNIVREVATMDDGLKFGGDMGAVNSVKLNKQVDVKGGITDATKLATGNNIGVTSGIDPTTNNATLNVQLAKDITGLNSVQIGGNTIKTDGDHITITTPSTTPGGNATVNKVANLGDEKHITQGNYTVGDKTIDTNAANDEVTLTYTDGNGNLVKDAANKPIMTKIKGIAKSDLSNISDAGKKVITGLGSIVEAGDNVTVTSTENTTTGQKTYTVNAVTPAVYTTPDGEKLTKKSDGKFYKADGSEYTGGDIIASFENPNANSIPTGKNSTTDGGMIVNNIGSAIKNQNPTMPAGQTATYLDKLKAAADAGSNVKNAAVNVSDLHNTAEALKSNELHIRPTVTNRTGETVNQNAGGTAESYKYDAATQSVTLKYNDGTGAGVTGTEAKIDLSDLANQITSGYTFKTNATENGGKVVNDAATPAAETAVANGGVVNYAAGKNLTVKQDIEKDGTGAATGKQTYTYALADEIGIGEKGQPGVAGKDGVDGKIGVNGKDGSSVVINGKDGSIGMTGPQGQAGKDGINGRDGANISMTSAKGEQVLINRDPAHSADTDKAERIVYVPKDASGNPIQDANGKNIVREVATMDDGLKFGGDMGTVNSVKLNKQVDVKGGITDTNKLATGNNIGVTSGIDPTTNNATLNVQLAKDLTGLNSVELGGNTIKTDGNHITITSPDTTPGATPGATVTNKVANLADEKHIKEGTYAVQNDGSVTLNYQDGNKKDLTETAKITGIAKQDLTNINDAGKNVITGLGTIVKAGDNVTVSEAADATTGQKTYTVNAVTPAVYTTPDGTKLTKDKDGKFHKEGETAEYTGDIITSFENPKAATGQTTKDGGMIVNNIGSAIKNQTPTMPAGQTATYLDKLKAAADDTKTQNAAVNVSDLHNTANALKNSELHIAPTAVKSGSTEAKGGAASGNTIPGAATQAYKYNATTKQVELTFNDGNGKAVADTKAVIDLSELAGSIQNYGFKTNADGNLKDGTTATATAVASGTTVTYAAGKNLTVEQEIAANGNQTYTYALNKDLTNLDKVVVNGKDGQPGKDGVTIIGPQGAAGTPGTNGIDGKVGISGKDGKDAVSISGKDGVGHIGLTGPQGPQGPAGTPGTPGANIDISTDHGTQTLVKPEANNDNKSERIVYVPKDKDGNPLKDTDGNVIKREVATMDDGLKFAGDDGTVIKKALGTQLDIVGGATGALSDNNIGVNNDNGKLKVQLAKKIDLTKDGSVTMGNTVVNNDGITITKPATATDPAKTVSLTGDGLNNGGNKITNVAAGTANTDAVNVKQLKDKVTTVESSDSSIKVVDKNVPTSATYDPDKGHQYDITINNQSVVEHAQTPVVYTDKDGNKLYKIVDPTTNTVTFNTKEDGTGTTVQPNEVIASMNNGGDSTTTPMKLNNVGSSIQKPNSTDTFLKQLEDANKNTPNGAVNVSDLKKTSDALIDKGLVFDANNKDPKTNKLGSKVTVSGTGALGASENFEDKYNTDNIRTNITQDPTGNTTIAIGLNKNLKGLESVSVPGKDGVDGRDGVSITGKDGTNGVDGKVGIAGKDGKDAVSISGKDGVGHIGLTGPAGKDGKNATADITVKEGKAGVDGKDGVDGITRIVYNDKDGNEHQVATHDDGLKFTGNNESTENKHKLNSVVKVQGEGVTENATSGKLEANGQEFKSAAGNIAVVAEKGDTLTVKMNKDLNLTKDGSLTVGDTKVNKDGITITNADPDKTVSVTGSGLNNGGNKITNVAAGTDNTDAVNVSQLKGSITTVKSSDGSITVTDANAGSTDPTKGHAYDIKVNNQGVVNNAQIPVVYTKDDGTKVYKQPDGTFNTAKDGSGDVVAANKVIASMNNAANSSTDPTKLQNVGSSIADKAGNTYLDKIDAAAADNHAKTGAVNVSDLKNTAVAIGKKGLNFGTQSTGPNSEIHKNLGEKLEIVGGGTKADDKYDASNIKTMTKDGKVVIGLDKDLKADSVTVGEKGQPGVPGKDGVDGKIGVNGKDGSAVVINGKDGSIGLNGKDGANGITIKGDKGVDGVDGVNGTNGITRIVYQDKDGNNHEVATHDDGMKFAGDDGQTNQDTNPQVIKKHLNKVVDIIGGADKTKLTDNNIGVNNDGGKLRVQLANELSGITKISNGGSSISIADVPAGATSPAVTISGGNLSMGDGTHNNKIVNLAAGTNDTDAVNYKQLKDSRTTVTSQDGSVTITPTQNGDSTNYDLKVNPPLDPRVDQLAEEIGRVGAQGAALSALKPIQYDPLEPTQIMAGYGNYRGNSAIAMGVAHYKNESTLIHGGISWAGGSSHMMANAGVTWKVGNRDSEAAVADRYRKGPISSAYAMQQEMAAMKAQNAGLKGEVSDLKAENEQMKAQIAAMMAKLGL